LSTVWSDILFNFAYDVRASGDQNLKNFETLLSAAKTTNVRRIVHASSIVVYDDWPNAEINENSSITKISDGSYRSAKIEMEDQLQSSGIPAAVLQPTIVYGPKSALWTGRILKQLRSGPVVLPKENGICNAVYVDDVVQAAIRASVLEELDFERFIISGPEPTTWHEFYQSHQSLVEGSQILKEPESALQSRLGNFDESANQKNGPSLAAKLSSGLRVLIGRDNFEHLIASLSKFSTTGKPIYPERSQLRLMTANGSCSIEKAKRELGYEPQIDLQAGISKISATLV